MAEGNNRIYIVLAAIVALLAGGAFWLMRSGDVADGEAVAEGDTEGAADPTERRHARLETKEIDERPAALGGEVREKDGGDPIEGAVVFLAPSTKGRLPPVGASPGPLVVKTDADGKWSIDTVPPGLYTVSASAKEHFPASIPSLKVAPAGENADLVIELAGGGLPLTGTVADYGGGGVEGAVVSATTSRGAQRGVPQAVFATMTDADGNYELYVPDRDLRLLAWHVDYVDERNTVKMQGAPRTVDFKLLPGCVIEGKVVRAEDGSAVADAVVSTQVAKTGSFNFGMGDNRIRTDAAGRFELRRLDAGVHQISASAPELATLAPVEVPVSIGQQVEGVEVVVAQAYDVGGFVVRKDDPEQGVGGLDVSLFSMMQGGMASTRTPTEDTGQFVIHGVRPGTYMLSPSGDEVYREGMMGGAVSVTVEDASIDDVVVEVMIGVKVTGRVEPPGPASVSLTAVDSAGGQQFGQGNGTAYVDDDGAFEIEGVKPGKWKVLASSEDGRSTGEVEIEVPDNGLSDVTVELEERAVVSGIVTDLGGAPIDDMELVLADLDANKARQRERARFFGPTGKSAKSDEQGRFEVTGVKPGSYELLAVSNREPLPIEGGSTERGGLPVTIEGSGSATDLTVKVDFSRGRIEGVVTGTGGTPLADVWVTAARTRDGDGPMRMFGFFAPDPALTDFEGRFVLEDLEDGDYDLTAEADDGSLRGSAKKVAVGSSAKIEVTEPARIEGVVRRAGKPVTSFELSSGGGMVMFGLRKIVDDEGRFTVERLDPGKHRVTVTADGGAASASVELKAGESKKVELELEPFGKVRGKAVYADSGEPAAGVRVMAFSTGGSRKFNDNLLKSLTEGGNTTGDDGSFEVEGLGAGKVNVSFAGGEMTEYRQLGTASGILEVGETLDLGEVKLLPDSELEEDQRGDLGFTPMARPSAPTGDDTGIEFPDETESPDDRLWVVTVGDTGPAAKAGLERGDEIIEIDGEPVAKLGAGTSSIRLQSNRIRKGQSVKLRVVSKGAEEGRAVTLTAQ